MFTRERRRRGDDEDRDPLLPEETYCYRQCGAEAFHCRSTLADCLREARAERRSMARREGERWASRG